MREHSSKRREDIKVCFVFIFALVLLALKDVVLQLSLSVF